MDNFLAGQIDGWSRARLQRLIEDEDVLVNGKTVKSSYKLHANDEIEVELTAGHLSTVLLPENIPLEIVYEDSDLIVVNKPAGLVVHPAAGSIRAHWQTPSYHFEQLSKHAGTIRPGIVHRLDKDTSGLLVVAKTEERMRSSRNSFARREVFKSYVALVHGVVGQDTGRIDQPIARDPVTGHAWQWSAQDDLRCRCFVCGAG